jgi:dihydroflavonol-4-reductase
MRYLVTGATGLVGNNVVRQLLARGDQVRVLLRGNGDPRPFAGLEIERAAGDVTDLESLRAACRDVNVLVNSAGVAKIGSQGLEAMRTVNVAGARNAAIAAREAGARLLHVSSVNAIGIGKKTEPADEEHFQPQRLKVPYAITKQEAEAAVREEIAKGLDAVLVNPGFMLGPYDWKPSSGRMLLEVVGRFVPATPWGGHCLCDVRDAVAGMLAAADRGRTGERYILGGHNISFYETWRMFARICGGRKPLVPLGPINRGILCLTADLVNLFKKEEGNFNSTALRMSTQYHYFSSAKAERELGYRIRPAEETIRDAWQWLQENGIK